MFKNKKFEVKMVDDVKTYEPLMSAPTATTFSMDPDQISNAVSDLVSGTAKTVVASYFAIKGFQTFCKVVEIVAKSISK